MTNTTSVKERTDYAQLSGSYQLKEENAGKLKLSEFSQN